MPPGVFVHLERNGARHEAVLRVQNCGASTRPITLKAVQDHYSGEIMSTSFAGNPLGASRNPIPRHRTIVRLFTVLAAAALAKGCGDGDSPIAPPPDPPRPTTVSVSLATDELTALGATVQLSAEVRDQNATVMAGATVIWTSSAISVATVDASGLVTAAGNGTATITASAGSASGSAVVTVMQSVASVVVSPSTDELTALGETVQLTAEAFDGNGHAVTGAEFSWESSDAAVATVDGSGLVTGVAEGVAMITASSGGTTQSAAVTVNLVPTSMLKVSGDGQRGEAGSPLPDSLVTEVRDQGGTPIAGAAVSWSVSSGGGVIASSQDRTDEAGRAFAWWTLGDTEGDQTVTARAGAVDVVFTAEAIPRLQASLNPSPASIQVGQSADFALTISGGSPGEQEGWTCTSFDVGVASVQFTASGCRATGLAEGSTTISAAVSKGTDRVTAVALLEVREPPSAVRITSNRARRVHRKSVWDHLWDWVLVLDLREPGDDWRPERLRLVGHSHSYHVDRSQS